MTLPNSATVNSFDLGGSSGSQTLVVDTVTGTDLSVVNDTTIITVVSQAEAGVRSIHVTTPNGTSAQTTADDHTYTPGA